VKNPVEEIFTKKYREHQWHAGPSRSGRGSDLLHTENIRIELPKLLKELKIKSILDIPCGDWYWLKTVNLDVLDYVGADIVEDIVTVNNKKFSGNNKKFIKLDIIRDTLPKVDLILCRDLFQHLSFTDIFKSMKNILSSNSKYLLVTSNPTVKSHKDILTGKARIVNLVCPPFSFPQPVRVINDSNLHKLNKRLYLWTIEDLQKNLVL